MTPIKIQRLSETATIPTYGSDQAAGMDLHADIAFPWTIAPGQRMVVPTNIAMQIPRGLALLICPRSGLSAKSGITVHNGPGVIDADYRGPIGVILHNTTEDSFFEVVPGDRIAQGVLVPVARAVFEEVDALEETARGTGGFGSTGVGKAA